MEEEKVNVKLEKHLWPDELQNRKKKKSITFLVIFLCLFSFLAGIISSSLMRPKPKPIIVNQPSTDDGIETEPKEIEVITDDQQIEKFQAIYSVLKSDWYFSKNMKNASEEIIDNAIKGMIEKNGDIHTAYMTAEENKEFEDSINQNYVGIGVQYYQVDGYSIVLKVFNNSPAEKSDVQPGDIFMKVDGTDVVNMDTDKIGTMVRGEEGSQVTIEFKRGEDIITKTITREAITSTTYAKMLNDKVGYLEINSFGLGTGDEVYKELVMLRNQGATKLIIDVRDNGGGYLVALNQIASYFLDPSQVVIAQEDVTGNIVKTYASGGEKFENFEKIVMLVNENTASASEVLALALRDNLNTPLVGTKTYGKGTVQTPLSMTDGSVLKYTVAQWLSPSGQRIHENGITPDYEIKIHEVFHAEIQPLDEGQKVKADTVHQDVIFLQQALDFLGYKPDRFDGYFSAETLKAYQKYCEDNKLEKKDYFTIEDLSALSSKVYQHYTQNSDKLDIQLEKALEILK